MIYLTEKELEEVLRDVLNDELVTIYLLDKILLKNDQAGNNQNIALTCINEKCCWNLKGRCDIVHICPGGRNK